VRNRGAAAPRLRLRKRLAGDLEEEPTPALRLIDPAFEKTGSGDVARFIAQRVDRAHAENQSLFIFVQLADHVLRRDEVGIVVGYALQAGDMADGADRGPADFAHALGNVVCHGEDLVAVVVEEQMVIAKMRAAHVPVEVFGLQVEAENIGEKCIERAGDVLHGLGAEVGGSIQRCLLAGKHVGVGGQDILLSQIRLLGAGHVRPAQPGEGRAQRLLLSGTDAPEALWRTPENRSQRDIAI